MEGAHPICILGVEECLDDYGLNKFIPERSGCVRCCSAVAIMTSQLAKKLESLLFTDVAFDT